VIIQGNNNTIGSGLTNVTLINTSNTVVEESNVTYVNGIQQVNYDVIDGGQDTVRSKYATTDIFTIEGGLDEVRDTFATSKTLTVSGGEDRV
jgi:hypothetical protein